MQGLTENKLLIISIWGMLPVFLAFIVFLCTIIIMHMKKEIISPVDEFRNKTKFHKTEKLYSKVDYVSEAYLLYCITLAAVPLLILLNAKYNLYILKMIKKIDVVSSIVLGLTAIAITLAVVVIVFDKGYYIVFSIREVLQKYKFSECLIVVVASCIIVSGNTMTLLNERLDSFFDCVRFLILEIATIYNVLGVTYILCVIINIMFLEQKKELNLLGQLYRTFWLYKIDTLHFKSKKNWNKEVIEVNIEYLLEKYINICKHKKIARIMDIEFVTTMGCYREKWCRKVRKKFVLVMGAFLLISGIIDIVALRGNYVLIWIILLNIIVAVISIICAYGNVQSFQLVLMRLCLDTWGYYLHTNDNKEIFVPRVALRISNSYDKYIRMMNSLNAFFYIWLNYVDKKKNIIEYEYEEMLLKLEAMDNKNMVTYFPAFTIGFFLYDKNMKIEKIKEYYKEMIVTENKKYLFERMMYSQIFYLTKNFDSKMLSNKNKINEYLQWLVG